MAQFFTTERIGHTREKTPEGYLLCRNVPISRTGVFDYTPLEVGIRGRGGRVRMTRTADELFRPETMASFEGKPIVIGHGVFPTSGNWSEVAQGHVQNVRRGDGEQSSMLIADLLIQKQEAIDRVESGELEEVSCGYDSEAIDDGDGCGHQEGIVGNHIALVTKARCDGCKLGDGSMPDTKTRSWKTRLRRLFKDSDEEGFNEALDQVDVQTKDEELPAPAPAPDPNVERIAKLEATVLTLVEQMAAMQKSAESVGGEDLENKTEEQVGDEDPDAEEVSEEEASKTFGDAETLCPGMKRPQGDSADGKFTAGLLKRVKREAIKGSGITTFGDSAALDGQALDVAFNAALEIVKARRNPVATGVGDSAPARCGNAILNERFKKFWSNK